MKVLNKYSKRVSETDSLLGYNKKEWLVISQDSAEKLEAIRLKKEKLNDYLLNQKKTVEDILAEETSEYLEERSSLGRKTVFKWAQRNNIIKAPEKLKAILFKDRKIKIVRDSARSGSFSTAILLAKDIEPNDFLTKEMIDEFIKMFQGLIRDLGEE